MQVDDKGNVRICSHMTADGETGLIVVEATEGTVVLGPSDLPGRYMYIQDADGNKIQLTDMALEHVVQASLLVMGAEDSMMNEAMDVLGMGEKDTHAKAIVVPDSVPNEERAAMGKEIEEAIQAILDKHGHGGARVRSAYFDGDQIRPTDEGPSKPSDTEAGDWQ